MAIPTLEIQLRDCHYQAPVAGHTGKVSRHDPVYSPIPSRGANEREYRLQPAVSGPSYVSDLDAGLGTVWILESIDQVRTLRPEVSGNDGARGSWNTSFKRQWKV